MTRVLASIGHWKGHVCTVHPKVETNVLTDEQEMDEIKILKIRVECKAFTVSPPEGKKLRAMLKWNEEQVRAYFKSGGKERPASARNKRGTGGKRGTDDSTECLAPARSANGADFREPVKEC
eukprot:CAMPEP_0119325640 /NCGR_PEP_ID=MMETSP1333-20130426/66337_1 /TAXON_ID=418940 /ORGANISM="Scyphosphaera apsteinii, Strain RCC1455" /LENGTH=121 /DNA_ID=CAMNT_0007333679 /DNA_START=247 /DNA_END=612 /DNA_ORIENTATION=+